jgi:hypothetical protein
MADDKIVFLAAFPAIQSSISVGDDGMRIQLQIDESQMETALWLVTVRDKLLKVTVEVAQETERTRTPRRRAAKHREQ